jgi:hypothetical protein
MNKPTSAIVMMNVGGSIDLGTINNIAAAKINRPAGPIRLPEGVPGRRGHGLLHIESNPHHSRMIKGLGFATAIDFVVDVAQNWSVILQGKNDRLILVREVTGYGYRIIVECSLHNGARCWSVVTAIPTRKIGPDDIVLFKKVTAG